MSIFLAIFSNAETSYSSSVNQTPMFQTASLQTFSFLQRLSSKIKYLNIKSNQLLSLLCSATSSYYSKKKKDRVWRYNQKQNIRFSNMKVLQFRNFSKRSCRMIRLRCNEGEKALKFIYLSFMAAATVLIANLRLKLVKMANK